MDQPGEGLLGVFFSTGCQAEKSEQPLEEETGGLDQTRPNKYSCEV